MAALPRSLSRRRHTRFRRGWGGRAGRAASRLCGPPVHTGRASLRGHAPAPCNSTVARPPHANSPIGGGSPGALARRDFRQLGDHRSPGRHRMARPSRGPLVNRGPGATSSGEPRIGTPGPQIGTTCLHTCGPRGPMHVKYPIYIGVAPCTCQPARERRGLGPTAAPAKWLPVTHNNGASKKIGGMRRYLTASHCSSLQKDYSCCLPAFKCLKVGFQLPQL